LKLQRVCNPFIKTNNSFSKLFSWQKALTLFNDTQKNIKPSEILFVAGNTLDLESSKVLKNISQNLGIDIISEQFLELDNKVMSNTRFNSTFVDILDSDLCLTVGTNIRFEASLLNVRLKQCVKRGNFIKASIGLNENLTYSNLSIGNSIQTLIKIAEGRHPFCKVLVKSKAPSLIIGSSVKKRLDSSSVTALLNTIAFNTNVISPN
jgi:NADH dehydrogenase (ubiquinone) Fe-S protein 1